MISLVQKYSGQTYRVYDEKGACKMLLNIGGDLLGWGPHFIVASWGKYNIILFDEKGLRYRNICIGDMTFVRVVGDTYILRQKLIGVAYLITYDRFGKYISQCIDENNY